MSANRVGPYPDVSTWPKPDLSPDPASVVLPPYPKSEALGIVWTYEPFQTLDRIMKVPKTVYDLTSGPCTTSFGYHRFFGYWVLNVSFSNGQEEYQFNLSSPVQFGESSDDKLKDNVMVFFSSGPISGSLTKILTESKVSKLIQLVASYLFICHISPKINNEPITEIVFRDRALQSIYTKIISENNNHIGTFSW